MKDEVLLLFIYLSTGVCLKDLEMKFTLDYFMHKNVKQLCLISCEVGDDNVWTHKLSVTALKYSIFTSEIKISDSLHLVKLRRCFDQKLVPVGVFINLQCQNFEDVALIASKNKWFDDSHKWIIFDSNFNRLAEDIGCINNTYIGNNASSINTKVDVYCREFFIKQNDTGLNVSVLENSKQTLQIVNETFKNDEGFEKLNEYNICLKLVRVLNSLNISVDADITFVNSIEEHLHLYDVYNFGKERGGNLIIEKFGLWSVENEVIPTLKTYKFYRRWDFQQLPIRMAVVTKDPENFDPLALKDYTALAPGIPDVVRNPAISHHVIAEIHNFRFKYNLMTTWITDVRDGNTKVAVNSMYYQQSDLNTAMRFAKEMLEFIDFLYPAVFSVETRYFYRIPTTGPGRLENQFLTPLSPTTWLCIFGIMPLCAFILFQATRFERRPSSAQFAIFSVIAALCQQFFEDNSDLVVKRNSSARKLTVFVTGLFCVLIYNYYTSSVVSWLLNGPPPSINSLEELLESPLELIYEDVGYTRSWFQVPTYYYNKRNAAVENKLREKVLQKRQNNDLTYYKPLEEGIDLVKAGGYAYHTEVNAANAEISKRFTQSELCELGSLDSIPATLLFPAVQKRSPYKEFFSWSIMRLKERGIIHCVRLRTTTKLFRCEGSSPRALALGGAAPAFLLLAIGYFVAVVILVLERLHARVLPINKYPSRKQIRKFRRLGLKLHNLTK